MLCPKCQAPNHERRRYCGRCGFAIARGCPRCAFTNALSDSFCGGCGQETDQAQVSPPSEGVHPPAPEKALSIRQLSLTDMQDLLVTPAPKPSQPLRSGVTQSELDQLFSGEP
jgi:hypothetical protein